MDTEKSGEITYKVYIDEESVAAASAQIVEIAKKVQELKALVDGLNSCIAETELKANIQS